MTKEAKLTIKPTLGPILCSNCGVLLGALALLISLLKIEGLDLASSEVERT